MKTPLHFIILSAYLLLTACTQDAAETNDVKSHTDLQTLYALLDTEIERSKVYEDAKAERIANLRREYALTSDREIRIKITDSLIAEFDAFNADSALYYVNQNLHQQTLSAHPGEYTRLMIKRADIYAHAGLFQDAIAVIQAIPRDSLKPELLECYYSTCCGIYQYLSEYTDEHETAITYEHQRTLYADSLNMVIQPDTFNHLVYVMSQMAREGQSEEAIKALSSHLEDYQTGTREYSILASVLAYIYKTAGYHDEYKRYLVLSAISDVRGAVKENMSFRALATVMYEDEDVERANRYLKKSIVDANFYSAFMRNAQSSKMLPVIDEAYASRQNQLTQRLRTMVWVSSVLSGVLVIACLLILTQFKKLRRANRRVCAINSELSDLTAQLQSANDELEKRNNDLRDYNRTKEQYAALFMEYCQSAISTLLQYQQSLRVLAAQGGSRTALLKKLESTATFEQMLKIFYAKFDEAILNIYPSFVEKFNSLLRPDDHMVLKSGELLNTELRLFALIRIGIDDSTKIAQFLRCSISTVYTYRSKIRKRAINPDRFEEDVRNIS